MPRAAPVTSATVPWREKSARAGSAEEGGVGAAEGEEEGGVGAAADSRDVIGVVDERWVREGEGGEGGKVM